jgi:molybdopterin-guanine dinucleotide biosynthesis protein A
MEIERTSITGLILAGGRGTRMGGVDKGLQPFRGQTLAHNALQRLQPQVGAVMINANRHLDVYRAMGIPVWSDATADFPGPLGGLLAGLQHCSTPWLASVPCDTPNFPLDLVARLAQAAVSARAPLATVATLEAGEARVQPVFSLVHVSLLPSLQDYLDAGERKILPWLRQHSAVEPLFEDNRAFFNANTLHDLQQLQA